jgi:AsmA protein
LIGVAVLVFAAGLAAPYFIPWDRLKDEAASSASKSLGRQLSIGKVEVGLFSGVHLKDIRLENAAGFGPDPLFSNADAKVSLSLLSLFSGRIVLSSIVFDRPRLLLETDAQGRNNLPGLASAAESPAPVARSQAQAKAATGGSTAPRPLPLLLAALEIKDGDLVLVDGKKGTRTAVHGLNLRLLGISLAAAGNSRLEASLSAELEGKRIPVTVLSDFHLDLPGQRLDILDFKATLPAVVATLTGAVRDFERPQVDLAADVDVAMGELPGLLPPSTLKGLPGGLVPQGTVTLALSVSGPLKTPKDLAMKGTLSVRGVGATVGGYPALADMNGTFYLDKAGASLKALGFKLGGDPATLDMDAHWGDLTTLSGGVSKLKAQIVLKLSSPKLNLDPLLGAGQPQAPAPSQGPAPAPSKPAGVQAQASTGLEDLRSSVPKGLDLRLDIDAESVAVHGLTTGRLAQRLVLRSQKADTNTQWDLYQGHFSGKMQLDFSQVGPAFRGDLQMRDMQLGQMLDDLAAAPGASQALKQLKGKVRGQLSFKANARGRGLQEPALSQYRQATASFQLKDGVISKTDAQESLAAVIPDPQTQALLRDDIKFSDAVGNLVVEGTKTTLKNFQLGSGADWRAGALYVQASGTQIEDGALDYHVVPHFNPAQVHVGGDLGRALQDERGWPTFDYIAYGGPTAAQAKADFTAGIRNAAARAVTNKVQDLLKNGAGNALKGLFGQ